MLYVHVVREMCDLNAAFTADAHSLHTCSRSCALRGMNTAIRSKLQVCTYSYMLLWQTRLKQARKQERNSSVDRHKR